MKANYMNMRMLPAILYALLFLFPSVRFSLGVDEIRSDQTQQLGDRRPLRTSKLDLEINLLWSDKLWLLKPLVEKTGGNSLQEGEIILFLHNRDSRRFPLLFLRVSAKDSVVKRVKADWLYGEQEFRTPEEMYKLLYEAEVETMRIPDNRIAPLFCQIGQWLNKNTSEAGNPDLGGNAMIESDLNVWIIESMRWSKIYYAEFGTLLGDFLSMAALINHGNFEKWEQPGMKKTVDSIYESAKANFENREQILRAPFLQKRLTEREISQGVERFPNLIPQHWLALSHREVDFSMVFPRVSEETKVEARGESIFRNILLGQGNASVVTRGDPLQSGHESEIEINLPGGWKIMASLDADLERNGSLLVVIDKTKYKLYKDLSGQIHFRLLEE